MKKLILAVSFFGVALSVHADDIVNLSVNTSSLAGTTGYIDFQFNPSPSGSQSATVQIKNFTGASYLPTSESDIGAVTGGPLPSTVSIVNSSSGLAINDDFEGLVLGTKLTLTLDFSGPAVSAPNGSSSPSTFYLSMFSDVNGTLPILTSNLRGILGTVAISPDTGLASFSSNTSNLQLVPEPGSLALLGAGVCGLVAWRRRRTRSACV